MDEVVLEKEWLKLLLQLLERELESHRGGAVDDSEVVVNKVANVVVEVSSSLVTGVGLDEVVLRVQSPQKWWLLVVLSCEEDESEDTLDVNSGETSTEVVVVEAEIELVVTQSSQ